MSLRRFITVAAALLIFQGALINAAAPIFHACSNAGNFTTNDKYDAALTSLLDYLRHQTPLNDGFALGSLGGSLQYRPYGLALCRGDASAADCRSCVAEAATEILHRCPNDRSAAIWYDGCTVRYSESDFFGRVDNQVGLAYLVNTANASDAASFNNKTKELMGQLAREAAYVAPKMFATGEIELAGVEKKLYGLVECSRDLWSGECKKCLGEAIRQLPSCCGGKVGGQVIGGSCRIRYEIYPFVSAGFRS